jgi:energy-coupling factor transport system ATP-binding protein
MVLITGASGCGKSTRAARGVTARRDGVPEHEPATDQPVAARVEWCLDVTGMAGMRHATTVTLSGGQKQRTAIAATLAMRPRILVLDEPLSDLDPVGAQEVLGTLRRLARDEGTGIVIIEHRVHEVVSWADRVVLMDDGRIKQDTSPRVAWDDEPPSWSTGVGVPDVVRLAHALPDVFAGQVPLSVDEAVAGLRGSWFVPQLASALRGGSAGSPPGSAEHRSAAASAASLCLRLAAAGLARRERRVRRQVGRRRRDVVHSER